MHQRALLAALLVAGAIAGSSSALAYTLGPAVFGSAGAPATGSTYVLGMTLGQTVAGGHAGTIAPNLDEGAGFWRWGRHLTVGVPDPAGLELAYALYPGAPNPFASHTLVRYAIPSAAGEVAVQLRIYDLSGRLVRTLDSGRRVGGIHEATWDGRDAAGHALGGGIYFCRVTAGTYAATRRLVLAR
jgi:hypothetical protein